MKTVLDQAVYSAPLYTRADASRLLGVPRTTLFNWGHGYDYPVSDGRGRSAPLISVAPPVNRRTLSYTGLAEAYVLTALKAAGLSTVEIRRSVDALKRQMNLPHALLSRRLRTDGVDLLYDYSGADEENAGGRIGLASVRSGQAVFREVVEQYLKTIRYEDEYAVSFQPKRFERVLVVDPHLNGGRASFVATGTPLESVRRRVMAGEDWREVAHDFDIPLRDAKRALAA